MLPGPEIGVDPNLKAGGVGLGLLGGSGLTRDSGLGLGCGLGARMGRIVVLLCSTKGFGVSLGLGPGAGFLGSCRWVLIIPGSSST